MKQKKLNIVNKNSINVDCVVLMSFFREDYHHGLKQICKKFQITFVDKKNVLTQEVMIENNTHLTKQHR